MQLIKLNQFQPISYASMNKNIPGNLIIALQLGSNYVTFKSFALKYSDNCQHYYINFLLNYYEAFYTKDNSYHLEFQLCYFELLPQFVGSGNKLHQKGYKLKNLKENFVIKSVIDQIIAVITYKETYFLYIIHLSKRKCFILDPQINPQSRFSDHENVTKTISEYFGFYNPLESCLLKEVKSETTIMIRVALILDFIYKYIDESNNVEKIENIKIRSSDARTMLDRISWFLHKCFNENIYITNEQRPQPKYFDKLLSYDEFKQQMQKDKDITINLKNETIPKFNKPTSPDSSISILSLMGKNQLNQSSFNLNQSKISQNQEMNAQSFLKQMMYKSEAPKQVIQTTNSNEAIMNRQEFETLLREAKQQIRQEVMDELKQEQDQRMRLYEQKVENKYNPLDEQIAQEYLTQVKFQRYKEYLDYLFEFYYNNDREEYFRLIDEYNQRLKDTALNGLVEVQKQEIIKLQSITKKRVLEQNQQVEIALFNQNKQFQDAVTSKKQYLEAKQDKVRSQLIENKQKQHFKYQLANVDLAIDPFEFRTDQQIEKIRNQRTVLDEIDLSTTEIKEMQQAWKFESSKGSISRSVYDYDEELDKIKQVFGNYQQTQENRVDTNSKYGSQYNRDRNDKNSNYQSNLDKLSQKSNSLLKEPKEYSNQIFSIKNPNSQRILPDPSQQVGSKQDPFSKVESFKDPVSKRNLDLSNKDPVSKRNLDLSNPISDVSQQNKQVQEQNKEKQLSKFGSLSRIE